MVWALRKFEPYLDGLDLITLITDHSALQWIFDYQGSNARLRRWAVELWQFIPRLKIIHRPGKTHSNVDALSRAPIDERAPVMDSEVLVALEVRADPAFVSALKSGYAADEHFRPIVEGLSAGNSQRLWDNYRLVDGVLYYIHPTREKWVVCIPATGTLRADLLHDAHDAESAGHLGSEKTLLEVSRLYFWPRMSRDVKRYVHSCDSCQRNKSSNLPPAGLLMPHPVAEGQWTTVTMDFA
jgi:hypothetical protein